jgi:hypothetical protein
MHSAAAIVLVLLVGLPAVLVGGLFVWAAVKDGQEDKALRSAWSSRSRARPTERPCPRTITTGQGAWFSEGDELTFPGIWVIVRVDTFRI